MDIFKTRRNASNGYKIKTGLTGLICIVLIFVFFQNALARETITVNDCDTCTYNVAAYNNSTRQYYYLQGVLTGNPATIEVPNGYASLLNLMKGRRVGARNLYEERDPLSPIFNIVNKSTYVLDIIYVGHRGATSVQPHGPGQGRQPAP